MKIAIDSPVTSYSSRLSSHKASWANYVRLCLQHSNPEHEYKVLTKKDNVHDFDTWIWVFPKELTGSSFNVFGGANDDVADRISRVLDFKGYMYCFREGEDLVPDIGAWVKSRQSKCSDKFAALNSAKLTELCMSIGTHSLKHYNKLVLGDSHSQSIWRPGYDLNRMDGKTLYSVLDDIPKLTLGYSEVILYFGNIDIRHHLASRSANTLQDMLYKLFNIIEDLPCKFTLTHALPIENESRKLPKTGYYNGKPFDGSWERRNSLMLEFNAGISAIASHLKLEVITWPKSYINDLGELKFEVMEKPKSVHLSPEYYITDQNTGSRNEKFKD